MYSLRSLRLNEPFSFRGPALRDAFSARFAVVRGSKTKIPGGQAGLTDDGACRADGKFFFGMRNDGRAAVGMTVFGVAALLRGEHKSVCL